MHRTAAPDPFVTHRSLLFTIAYQMLGSATDAEDVVQETWLRWSGVDRARVRDPRAFLVTVVTREALRRLRAISRRREEYVGQWLPEPLLTAPDLAEDVELAESVSIAMLTVLETLGHTERAVFVLHEAFEVPYAEIGEVIGKAPATVRQIAHRARAHVAARRPRMQVDRAEQVEIVDRFLTALTSGDLDGLLTVLAPDVVAIADGGGLAPAARTPVRGRELVAGLLARFTAAAGDVRFTTVSVNGAAGIRMDLAGEVRALVSFAISDGRITRIFATSNPDKLQRLDAPAPLARGSEESA